MASPTWYTFDLDWMAVTHLGGLGPVGALLTYTLHSLYTRRFDVSSEQRSTFSARMDVHWSTSKNGPLR